MVKCSLKPRRPIWRESKIRAGRKNVREGFFERSDFEALVKELPEDIQDFARFGYLTGWSKGKIASLTWAQFEMDSRMMRLRGRARILCANSITMMPPVIETLEAKHGLQTRRWFGTRVRCRGFFRTPR